METLTILSHVFATAFFIFSINYIWDQVRKKHVFIIEDNPFDESLIKATLKLENAKIHYCQNYNTYLVKRIFQKPDAVIVDYLLPDCEGDKIFKLCRGQAIPTIMMTAEEGPIRGIDDKHIIRKRYNYVEQLRTFLKGYSIA